MSSGHEGLAAAQQAAILYSMLTPSILRTLGQRKEAWWEEQF